MTMAVAEGAEVAETAEVAEAAGWLVLIVMASLEVLLVLSRRYACV